MDKVKVINDDDGRGKATIVIRVDEDGDTVYKELRRKGYVSVEKHPDFKDELREQDMLMYNPAINNLVVCKNPNYYLDGRHDKAEPNGVNLSYRVDGYEELERVLHMAYRQSADGKGRERHANDKPFTDQPIAHDTKTFGVGFPLGQASKKIKESMGMIRRHEGEAAQAEILGAIVYLCAAWLEVERMNQDRV